MNSRFWLSTFVVVAVALSAAQTLAAPKKSGFRKAGAAFCDVAADVVNDTRTWIRKRVGAESPKGGGKVEAGCNFVWGKVADGFSERDKKGLSDATEDAMEDDRGSRREYAARDSKRVVVLETVGADTRNRDVEFTLLSGVAAPPRGVEVVSKPFKTTAALNLRSSPDSSQKDNVVGTFARNETVAVMAKTADGWALIGAKGYDPDAPDDYVGVGYASMKYLADPTVKTVLRKSPTAKPKAAPRQQVAADGSVPQGGVSRAKVKASTQCKTVSATTGKTSESKTGCATPSGRYEVV